MPNVHPSDDLSGSESLLSQPDKEGLDLVWQQVLQIDFLTHNLPILLEDQGLSTRAGKGPTHVRKLLPNISHVRDNMRRSKRRHKKTAPLCREAVTGY